VSERHLARHPEEEKFSLEEEIFFQRRNFSSKEEIFLPKKKSLFQRRNVGRQRRNVSRKFSDVWVTSASISFLEEFFTRPKTPHVLQRPPKGALYDHGRNATVTSHATYTSWRNLYRSSTIMRGDGWAAILRDLSILSVEISMLRWRTMRCCARHCRNIYT